MSPKQAAAPHPSLEEGTQRLLHAQGGPAQRSRGMGVGAGPPRPGRASRAAGGHAGAGAGPRALRADAGVAVRVLPGRGRHLRLRPCTGAADRHRVQLGGDAHLANFGVYAAPARSLVFDMNDFDETLPGPFEWDLKRLAASFEIASRANGFDSAESAKVVTALVLSYCSASDRDGVHGQLGRVVHPADDGRPGPPLGRRGIESGEEGLRADDTEGREKGPPPGLGQAHHPRRRGAALRQPSPAPGAGQRAGRRWSPCRAGRPDQRRCSSAIGASLPPIAAHCSSATGSWTLARKVVGVGSVGTRAWVVLLSAATTRIPCSSRSRRPRHRCWNLPGPQQVRAARSACRRGPAAHASGQRRVARLDPDRRRRRRPP